MKKNNARYVFTSFIGIYMLIELITGIISESIALQTDAIHMVSDFIALLIACISEYLSERGTTNIRYSYGLKRTEFLGGFFNSTFMLINLFWLVRENITRFVELQSEDYILQLSENIDSVLIVAVLGLIINIVGLKLFHEHDNSSHNHKAVSLHLVSDLLGSIVVVISSCFIKWNRYNWRFYLDPIGSGLIIILLFPITIKTLMKSTRSLLQKSPRDINIENLRKDILAIDGIENLHELHVWCVDSNINIASMHIKTIKKGVISQIKGVLHNYNIHSSSIERERGECSEKNCKENCRIRKCCQL